MYVYAQKSFSFISQASHIGFDEGAEISRSSEHTPCEIITDPSSWIGRPITWSHVMQSRREGKI